MDDDDDDDDAKCLCQPGKEVLGKVPLICQPVRDCVFFLAKFRQLATKKNPVPPLKRDFKKKTFKKFAIFL